MRRLVAPGADQLIWRRRGIRQRTEHVEHRAHTERAAHGHDCFHRRVICGRKQESEIQCLEAIDRGLLVERQRHAESLQYVGAARLAGNGAIAVFDNSRPGGRGEQAGAGRQVKAARIVAAGTDRIYCRRTGRNCRS